MLWLNTKDQVSRELTTELKGWVSSRLWWTSGVSDQHIEILYDDVVIGECVTNSKGFFSFTHSFEKRGFYCLSVRLKDKPLRKEILNVLILDQSDNIKAIICDVDNTLVHFSFWSFLLGFKMKALAFAKETLCQYAKTHQIIYLTHRDQRFSNLTKLWIHDNGFPKGPVFFWSVSEDPLSSKKYKIKTLKRLKAKTDLEFLLGFGDRESDIYAYKKVGIKKTFLIEDSGSWEKIHKEI